MPTRHGRGERGTERDREGALGSHVSEDRENNPREGWRDDVKDTSQTWKGKSQRRKLRETEKH